MQLVLIMLGGFAYVLFLFHGLHEKQDADRQFEAAPICASAGAQTDGPPGCRLDAPMQVTDSSRVTFYRGTDDCLTLRSETGGVYRVQFSAPSKVWEAAPVGQVVGTQQWQGNVVSVSAGGLTEITNHNPGGRARVGLFVAVVALVTWGLFAFVLVLAGVKGKL